MRILNRGTFNRVRIPQSESGFTLLEIVLVVAVLALLVGIAVPRLPDMAGTRIHQSARKVSILLKLARSRAIALRRYYRVEVDLETSGLSASYFGPEGTYITDDEIRQVTLKDSFIADVVNSGEGKVLEGKGWVRISPRGFIEPSLIHIHDDQERKVTVAPSPVSGRVYIYDGYTEFAQK